MKWLARLAAWFCRPGRVPCSCCKQEFTHLRAFGLCEECFFRLLGIWEKQRKERP